MDLEKIHQIRNKKRIRQVLAREDPLWFALLYLPHHFSSPFAPFHMEMFEILRNPKHELVAMMAFRESGKSTIMNMVNTLWSVLGRQEKKFIVIASKTQEQAKNHFNNIKTELENNHLLREDFGPFMESRSDWNKMSLELEYHGAKILSLARDQSVRGLKYGQFRPDLIICDDLEDTHTSRADTEALYQRFQSEILPLGDTNTRIVILGNLISEESFIMKLRDEIIANPKSLSRTYPILDDNKKCLWPQRFPDKNSLDKLRDKFSPEAWVREYLLSFDDDEYQDEGINTEFKTDEDRANDKIVSARARKKWRETMAKYIQDIGYKDFQTPLIHQMNGFEISTPITGGVPVLEENDPQYTRYQQYESEMEALVEEFHEELKQAMHHRVIDEQNRKRAKQGLPPISKDRVYEKINPEDIEWPEEDFNYSAPSAVLWEGRRGNVVYDPDKEERPNTDWRLTKD